MPRKGITVYLPPHLEVKVRKVAAEEHRSESSVIAEAVKARYAGRANDGRAIDGAGEKFAPTLTPQHFENRLHARLDKAIGEAIIVKEVVLLFIRVWLEHNPPIDEEHEDAAAASAEARFDRFLDLVANGLNSGRSISNGAHYPPPTAETANGAADRNHDAPPQQ